jgi:hypothetical protein
MPDIGISVTEDTVALVFDSAWLGVNPLTVADLDREVGYLAAVGYKLTYQ